MEAVDEIMVPEKVVRADLPVAWVETEPTSQELIQQLQQQLVLREVEMAEMAVVLEIMETRAIFLVVAVEGRVTPHRIVPVVLVLQVL
jgi:hypothetical protein